MSTWTLPVATMARLDDTTARLLAGTMTTPVRSDDRAPIPADSAAMVLTVDQWRRKYGRRVAA